LNKSEAIKAFPMLDIGNAFFIGPRFFGHRRLFQDDTCEVQLLLETTTSDTVAFAFHRRFQRSRLPDRVSFDNSPSAAR
jgi:hypothetical protein